MNIYIDIYQYKRAVTGLETASLVGNIGRLTSITLAGATALAVGPATTVALSMFDQLTLFDGDSSEIVQVGTDTPIGSTSIPLLQPTQYAHPQYIAYCSDGILGSLADALVGASDWIENITQQSLFQQTYTETLILPTMRGSLDNRNNLVFRPRHFPVLADTGLIIKSNNADPVSYDASQIVLDGAKQVVTVPYLVNVASAQGAAQTLYGRPVSRTEKLFLTITYAAGYTPDQMPGDITDIATLFTSEIIARRQNPTGANQIQLGDKRIQVTSTRDTVGESLLIKTAKQKLQPYSVEAF